MGIKNIPQKGEVWWTDFGIPTDSTTGYVRPAIIVSNNYSNKYNNRCTVIPITSNITKVYPGECLINLKQKKGKAMTDQIVARDKVDIQKKITNISDKELHILEQAMRTHLDL